MGGGPLGDAFGYGIIGCGWVASAHAWGVRSLLDEDVTLAAVADKDLDRAHQLAGEFGAKSAYGDYHDLLARPDVHAVSICLPDFLHEEVTLAAAAAGKHVLCEKPLALDVAGADRMLEACQKHGVQLGLIMNHRYFADNITAKRIISDGGVGRMVVGAVVHVSGLTGNPDGRSPWRGRKGLAAGGVLSTQAIHFLDLLLWFMGPAVEVRGWTDTVLRRDQDHEDTAALVLRLASGALATLTTTNATPIMDDFTGTRIELHGVDGYLLLEGDQLRAKNTIDGFVASTVHLPPPPEGAREVAFGLGHIYEIADFVRAVRAGRSAPVPGADGRHLMAVLEAVYASARDGPAVAVEVGPSAYASGELDGSLLYLQSPARGHTRSRDMGSGSAG